MKEGMRKYRLSSNEKGDWTLFGWVSVLFGGHKRRRGGIEGVKAAGMVRLRRVHSLLTRRQSP